MGWWEALYPGKCASCGEQINVGDTITRDPDGQIIHTDCTFGYRPTLFKPVCTTCWLEKPCGCDDNQ